MVYGHSTCIYILESAHRNRLKYHHANLLHFIPQFDLKIEADSASEMSLIIRLRHWQNPKFQSPLWACRLSYTKKIRKKVVNLKWSYSKRPLCFL